MNTKTKRYPWEQDRKEFAVIDKNGKVWGQYLYKDMAENVAKRNNNDYGAGVGQFRPFTVKEVA